MKSISFIVLFFLPFGDVFAGKPIPTIVIPIDQLSGTQPFLSQEVLNQGGSGTVKVWEHIDSSGKTWYMVGDGHHTAHNLAQGSKTIKVKVYPKSYFPRATSPNVPNMVGTWPKVVDKFPSGTQMQGPPGYFGEPGRLPGGGPRTIRKPKHCALPARSGGRGIAGNAGKATATGIGLAHSIYMSLAEGWAWIGVSSLEQAAENRGDLIGDLANPELSMTAGDPVFDPTRPGTVSSQGVSGPNRLILQWYNDSTFRFLGLY